MATGKQAQGKPLISLTDGKQIGQVKDLYLDETLSQITGVYLGAEGLIKRKEMAVPRASIVLMGIDAWLVTDSNVIVAPEDLALHETFLLIGALRGREIHTEGGTKLGVVDDVIFDTEGQVLGFALGKVFVQGTVADRKTIARSAISTVGASTSAMTTDMAKAEGTQLPSS